MLCSCAWDFTSWNSGCAANNDLYPPDKLEAMLNVSSQKQADPNIDTFGGKYNEVIIDSAEYRDQLPTSIAWSIWLHWYIQAQLPPPPIFMVLATAASLRSGDSECTRTGSSKTVFSGGAAPTTATGVALKKPLEKDIAAPVLVSPPPPRATKTTAATSKTSATPPVAAIVFLAGVHASAETPSNRDGSAASSSYSGT